MNELVNITVTENWKYDSMHRRWKHKKEGYTVNIKEDGGYYIYLIFNGKQYLIDYNPLFINSISRAQYLMFILTSRKTVEELIEKDRGEYGYMEYLEKYIPVVSDS